MKAENFLYKISTENQARIPAEDDPVLLAALKHFGDVRGSTLLDLGCGAGRTSLFFAPICLVASEGSLV